MTFTWRRTTPDSHHAFTAHDRDEAVGSIAREEGGPADGTWFWSAWGVHRGPNEAPEIQPRSGRVATRDEAIEALGAAWRRAKVWSQRTGKPLKTSMAPYGPGVKRPVEEPQQIGTGMAEFVS